MARWRDVKKGNITTTEEKKNNNTSNLGQPRDASALERTKAFITDMFMIMMPIMYITTYVIMDGKDDFQGSDIAHWVTMAVYGIITILFWIKKGQTPGFKAYDLKIIDEKTQQIPTFTLALFRYFMFIFSAVTIVGFLLPFFRKDKKTLQDIITGTAVIKDPSLS